MHGAFQASITTTCQAVFASGRVTLNLLPTQLWTLSGTGETSFVIRRMCALFVCGAYGTGAAGRTSPCLSTAAS